MSEPSYELFHPDFPTLVHAIRWWGERTPDRVAVAFLAEGETETARLTYSELDRAAQRVAAILQGRLHPGSRALLCFPPGLDFVISYFGCLYAQIIAVPVFAPSSARHVGRLSAVATDADAAIALTNARTVRGIETKNIPGLQDITSFLGAPWLTIEDIQAHTATDLVS